MSTKENILRILAAKAGLTEQCLTNELKDSFGDHLPIVVLSGSQCTGKSTIAKELAKLMNGAAVAEAKSLRVEELSALLSGYATMRHNVYGVPEATLAPVESPEDFDKELGLTAIREIASASYAADDISYIATYTCRMGGALVTALKRIGRRNIYSVHLTVGHSDKVARIIAREQKLNNNAAPIPHKALIDILLRDHIDNERLKQLYNQDPAEANHDLTYDTSTTDAKMIVRKILDHIGINKESEVMEVTIGHDNASKPLSYRMVVPGKLVGEIPELGEHLIETDFNAIVWGYEMRVGHKDKDHKKEIEDLKNAKEYLEVRIKNLTRAMCTKTVIGKT